MQAFNTQRKKIASKYMNSNFSGMIVTWREGVYPGAPTYIEDLNMRHPNLMILEVACFHAYVVVFIIIIIHLFTLFALDRWDRVRL